MLVRVLQKLREKKRLKLKSLIVIKRVTSMTSMTLVTLFWKKSKSKICHKVQKMTSMNLQK